jgi:hypothetical protein
MNQHLSWRRTQSPSNLSLGSNSLANREITFQFWALFFDSCSYSTSNLNGLQPNSVRNGTGNFPDGTGNLLE